MCIVQIGANAQGAMTFHGFEAVFNHIIKRLLHLPTIQSKQRQVSAQFLFDDHVAVLNFGSEKAHRFLNDRVHIFRMEPRLRRPDRTQKLGDNGIKAADFGTGNIDRLLKFRRRIVVQFLCLALHQL